MLVAVEIGLDTYVRRKTREQAKAPRGRKPEAAPGAAPVGGAVAAG